MKRILLFLTLFIQASIFGQAIPNGGFEKWNNVTIQDPQYYSTSSDNNNGIPSLSYSVNAIRTTAAWHGTYAIQLSSVLLGPDTLFGYVIDGSPGNGNQVSGGIPYSQKPTGIRLHYKYTTTTTDSAMILVWFKKAGSVIGFYHFKISNTTTSYTLFAGAFTPALTTAPDSVVWGATSSTFNLSSNSQAGGRPGSILTIDSVNFTGVSLQPADMNGDFENWSPVDTVFLPLGWYTQPAFRWSTDAHSGKYSAQLSTEFIANYGQVSGAQMSTGYETCLNTCTGNCNCPQKGGYPYSNTNDTLTFWYKYAPVGIDTGWMQVTFLKDTAFQSTGMNFFNTGGTWQYVSFPLTTGKIPDSLVVTFGSSNSSAQGISSSHIGTVLKLDDLQLKSEPLAVNDLKGIEANIVLYPVPSEGKFSVNGLERGMRLDIYDFTGRQISSLVADNETMNLNLTNYANGMYLLKVSAADGGFVTEKKVVIDK